MIASSRLPVLEANNLFLFGAMMKNAWRPASTPPFALVAFTLIRWSNFVFIGTHFSCRSSALNLLASAVDLYRCTSYPTVTSAISPEIERSKREADCSPLSSAELKSVGRTSTSSYAFTSTDSRSLYIVRGKGHPGRCHEGLDGE